MTTETRIHYLDCPTPEVAKVVTSAEWVLLPTLDPNVIADFGRPPKPKPKDLLLIREPWVYVNGGDPFPLRLHPTKPRFEHQVQRATTMPDSIATRRTIREVQGPVRVARDVEKDIGLDILGLRDKGAVTVNDFCLGLKRFWKRLYPDTPFDTAGAWLVRCCKRNSEPLPDTLEALD